MIAYDYDTGESVQVINEGDTFLGKRLYAMDGSEYVVVAYNSDSGYCEDIKVQKYDVHFKIYGHTIRKIEKELNKIGFEIVRM